MKISIQTLDGLEVTFEGDEAEFDRFMSLLDALSERAQLLSGQPDRGSAGDLTPATPTLPHGTNNSKDPLDPQVLLDRFERVKATSDIERVTVLAQAAVEAGRDGIDFQTADQIYNALAIPKPVRWKSAFGNARSKGYVQNAARGLWRPTVPGENFSNFGSKNTRAAKKKSSPQGQGQLR